jgi:glycosyltransferase involved in cell wall biosynthesis
MRICYALLSPTFGMHQYTADLANRLASAGHDVHLMTTTSVPRDRYTSAVAIHTPVATTNTGFSREGLRFSALRDLRSVICDLHPDVVHFTGPHLWNVSLVQALVAQSIPVVHTLHDLDPHRGVRYGSLIRLWNRLIVRTADHILVHGQVYRQRLLNWGVSPQRITWTPLLFLFLGKNWLTSSSGLIDSIEYQPWALFFGRIERYKGLEHLITACAMMDETQARTPQVVLAGAGDLSSFWAGSLPRRLELRNHFIDDAEAMDLFRRCGLVVLPYIDATQSAQIAAAYYFRKPVVVTRSGALPEYVEEGRTGYVVEPGHPATLARCMERMLSDPAQLARMGEAGRTWYDEQRVAEKQTLLTMYRQVGGRENNVESLDKTQGTWSEI